MTLAQFHGFIEASVRQERGRIASTAFAMRIAGAPAADYKKAIKELDKPD